MRKEIQRYGNNLVLVFTKAEEKIHKLARGDLLDVDIKSLIKKPEEIKGQ